MLFVKTHLEKSTAHGIGQFAGQFIAKGSVVYQPSPNFDMDISDADFQKLDMFSMEHIRHYGYFDKRTGRWHLAFDDIRFCNHADVGNISADTEATEYKLIAVKDIVVGEELLQNYREFEQLRKDLEK